MLFFALLSILFQVKAREYGTLGTLMKVLSFGTKPVPRKLEEDIDTDKEA